MKILHHLILTLMLATTAVPHETNPLLQTEDPAKPTALYAHGFCGNQLRALYYLKGSEATLDQLYPRTGKLFHPKKDYYLFTPEQHNVRTFNFPDVHIDAGILGSIVNLKNTAISQTDDVNALYKELQKITSTRKIGLGVSRGSATWLSMLGLNPSVKLDALILECPFARIQDTSAYQSLLRNIQFFFPSLTSEQVHAKAAELFKSVLKNHDPVGAQPITLAPHINKEIPILIIHSQQDKVIPVSNARALAAMFKAHHFPHVYYLELPAGPHGKLLWNAAAGTQYRNVIHAFFKKYDLPYNPIFAAGEDIERYKV